MMTSDYCDVGRLYLRIGDFVRPTFQVSTKNLGSWCWCKKKGPTFAKLGVFFLSVSNFQLWKWVGSRESTSLPFPRQQINIEFPRIYFYCDIERFSKIMAGFTWNKNLSYPGTILIFITSFPIILPRPIVLCESGREVAIAARTKPPILNTKNQHQKLAQQAIVQLTLAEQNHSLILPQSAIRNPQSASLPGSYDDDVYLPAALLPTVA